MPKINPNPCSANKIAIKQKTPYGATLINIIIYLVQITFKSEKNVAILRPFSPEAFIETPINIAATITCNILPSAIALIGLLGMMLPTNSHNDGVPFWTILPLVATSRYKSEPKLKILATNNANNIALKVVIRTHCIDLNPTRPTAPPLSKEVIPQIIETKTIGTTNICIRAIKALPPKRNTLFINCIPWTLDGKNFMTRPKATPANININIFTVKVLFIYTPRRMNLMLYSGTSCAFALAKKRSGQLALLAVAKFGNPAKFVLPLFFAVLIYVTINSGRKKQGRRATNSLGANLNCRRQAPMARSRDSAA